jgi:hypothetical protein
MRSAVGADPHHQHRSPTHGYEPTREAGMAAFARSWRRELLECFWVTAGLKHKR